MIENKIIDLCKLGNCPAVCTNKKTVELFPGEYLSFCESTGECRFKKRGLLTIKEEEQTKFIEDRYNDV